MTGVPSQTYEGDTQQGGTDAFDSAQDQESQDEDVGLRELEPGTKGTRVATPKLEDVSLFA